MTKDQTLALCALGLFLIAVAILNIVSRHELHDGQWHHVTLRPWRNITFADGTSQRGGDVVRRQIKGEWQYRRTTDAEELSELQTKAW